MNAATAAILAFASAASATSSDAGDPSKHGCVPTFTGLNAPHPVAPHQPLSLNDPRSGLTLSLASDGRHMTAKTRGGKIVWQRDLFADPRLEWEIGGPPDIQLPGEPHLSEARQHQKLRAYIAKLSITGMRVVSDCEAQQLDRTQPLFWGHYVAAWSGARYTFRLDANTSDLLVSDKN